MNRKSSTSRHQNDARKKACAAVPLLTVEASVRGGGAVFGAQAISNRRTAPAHGFGSSTRNHANKIFMGAEHAKTSSASCTPGPCYEVAGACGNQQDSGKLSPPQWCFGTAERFGGSPRKRTPGPGAYENAGAFGQQSLSNRSSFPLYGFGTVDRSMASKVQAEPPPRHPSPAPRHPTA